MEQRLCSHCQKPVPLSLAFCPHDGTRVNHAPQSQTNLRALPKNSSQETTNKRLLPEREPTHQINAPEITQKLSTPEAKTWLDALPTMPEQTTARTPDASKSTLELSGNTIDGASGDSVGRKPGDSVGEYILQELIGVGGMGEVWSAYQPTIGAKVAIKLLHLDRLAHRNSFQRFIQEARAVNGFGVA